MISISFIGGILLCIGAFLTMKGRVYLSVGTYILADFCWIILSYKNNDIVGLTFVVLGTILGIIAFIKMFKGIMSKTLDHSN